LEKLKEEVDLEKLVKLEAGMGDVVRDVETVKRDMEFLNHAIKDEEGWLSEKFEGKTHVKYKQLPQSKTVSIKIEAELDISIFNLCALIYEIELFKNWVPFCDKSYTIKKIKRAEKVVYLKLGLPILSDREAYMDGFGVDRLDENGTILIICKTIHNNEEMKKRL